MILTDIDWFDTNQHVLKTRAVILNTATRGQQENHLSTVSDLEPRETDQYWYHGCHY